LFTLDESMYSCILLCTPVVKRVQTCTGKQDVGIRYRVWIVRDEGWHPDSPGQPTGAIAIEPAEKGTMTARQAQRYIEAFDRAAQGHARRFRAVALPVTIRYLGDPQPGERLAANAMTELVRKEKPQRA
jgi:hypothetical protein